MKQNCLNVAVISSLIFFASCGGTTASHEGLDTTDSSATQKQTEPLAVSWNDLEADAIKPETTILFEGYIGDIGSYVDQTGGEVRIPIYERRNQAAGFKLNLYVEIGDGANQMNELPAEFAPSDIRILCDDKTPVTVGDRVRITATKSETFTEGFITAQALKIELVERDFDEQIFSQATALTAEMMQDTTLTASYCYVDGKLEIPSIVFSYTNEISLDLKSSSLKDLTSVSVRLGEGASTMNDLPDNYTTSDLVVRDYLGNPVKYGTLVRLYGTWERYSFESTIPGTFHLEEITLVAK